MMRFVRRGLISLVGVMGLAIPGVSAASPPAGVSVKATYAGGLAAFVTVTDHGHRFLFQVDTGASSSAVTARTATALGLAPSGSAQSVQTIGCRASVREAQISGWQLGTVTLPSTRVGIVDNSLSREKIGGMRVSGLLGSDVLSQFGTVTFDLASGRLVLGGATRSPRAGIAMRVTRAGGGVTESVRATIDRHTARYVLDTGSPTTVVPASIASRSRLRSLGTTKVHGAVGCALTAHLTQITEWAAGGQPLPSTLALTVRSTALKPSARAPAIGLIGAETLFGFGRLSLDFTHHRLILGSPSPRAQHAATLGAPLKR